MKEHKSMGEGIQNKVVSAILCPDPRKGSDKGWPFFTLLFKAETNTKE